jgi:glycosyltransferase involved in cell wall biosynthesis
VVPTGVDLGRFRPGEAAAARRQLGLPAGDPVVLYVGRLDREKSVGRVLAAFEHVTGTVRDARLVLVGHGTEAERLRRRAAASPAADRIHFLGVRAHAETVTCYQAADVFLFGSETETQGLVLAEAAACGVPAVSVSASGCDEVVRDGESGVLVKADPESLGEAAIGLLLDPQRRRAMAARAREVAERDFDVSVQIDRTLELYERARRATRT